MNQKLDYLFKKVGYGATKTDTQMLTNLLNEAIPSIIKEVIEFGNN